MKNFGQYNNKRFVKEWKPYHGNFLRYWIRIVLPIYLAAAVLIRIAIYGFNDILGLSMLIWMVLFVGMASVVTYHFNYKRHVKRYEDMKEREKF